MGRMTIWDRLKSISRTSKSARIAPGILETVEEEEAWADMMASANEPRFQENEDRRQRSATASQTKWVKNYSVSRML